MFYWFSYHLKTIFMFLLLCAAIGTSYYFYDQNQKTLKLLQNPKVASEEEKRQLIAKVGALMEIPSDDDPSIVTVLDEEKVKDQPFFKNAKTGDKVLVFSKAKEAVIYRPASNKIIKVGPIDTSTASAQSYKIALYTATRDLDSLDQLERTIRDKYENIEFTSRETTQKNNYSKNLVIDLSGNNKSMAENLAKEVGGIVSSLPSGETKPTEADFLIIAAN